MSEASTTRTVIPISELAGAVGTSLGPSAWRLVDQDRVDRFAEATDDHQWIHVDPERAAKTPFGSTVAHGYLTLALAPTLLDEILEVDGAGMVINYGANRVRFPAPVQSGSRVRMAADVVAAETTKDGATQLNLMLTFEADTSEKPVCVAEIVFRYHPQREGSERPSRTESARRDPEPSAEPVGSTAALAGAHVPAPDAAQLAGAWLRWIGGSYGVWATSLERSQRAALGDASALVPPLAQHAELAARFWADLFATPETPRDGARR